MKWASKIPKFSRTTVTLISFFILVSTLLPVSYGVSAQLCPKNEEEDQIQKDTLYIEKDAIATECVKLLQPDFEYTPVEPYTFENINFIDRTEPSIFTILSWTWSFGDEETSNEQNPFHAYRISDEYTVTLEIKAHVKIKNYYDFNKEKYEKMHKDNIDEYSLNDYIEITDTIQKTLTILNQKPVSSFSYTPNEPDTSTLIYFNDNSYDNDGSICYYLWDFGDGTYSSEQNPMHGYNSAGTYSVKLTVRDDKNAADSKALSITVQRANNQPVAVDDTASVEIGSQISIPVLDNDVDVEDGVPAFDGIVSGPQYGVATARYGNSFLLIEYSSNSSVAVPEGGSLVDSFEYRVVDSGGLTDTAVVNITILDDNDPPVAKDDHVAIDVDSFDGKIDVLINDYDSDNDTISIVDTTNGSYASTSHDGSYVYYHLPLPISGGQPSSPISDEFTYTISDGNGGSDMATVLVFILAHENVPPIVSDIHDQTVNEGENFTCIDLSGNVSDPDNTDCDIEWTYSGNSDLELIFSKISGLPECSQELFINYPDAWIGSEIITFTATDPEGLSDSDNVTFTVLPVYEFPVAEAGGPYSGFVGEAVTFNGSDSYDNDGDIREYQWSYSVDGVPFVPHAIGTGVTVDYSWDEAGIYNIELLVIDDDGLEDTDGTTVIITNRGQPPVVSDIPDQVINESGYFDEIPLNGFVSDSDGSDSDISWSVSGNVALDVDIGYLRTGGGDPPVNDKYYFANISYENWTGSETVTFTATDLDGLSGSDDVTFTVIDVNELPVANASGPYFGEVGEEILFNASESYDSDGIIVNYTWSFGDGSKGYGVITEHAYTQIGEYLVNLSIVDDCGLTDYNTTYAKITLDSGDDEIPTETHPGGGSNHNNPPPPVTTVIDDNLPEDISGPEESDETIINEEINNPPVAKAGFRVKEDSIEFDASESSDSDGDELFYRWDFNNDGNWDTDYSGESRVVYNYQKDTEQEGVKGQARVEVFDGESSDEVTVSYVIEGCVEPLKEVTSKASSEKQYYLVVEWWFVFVSIIFSLVLALYVYKKRCLLIKKIKTNNYISKNKQKNLCKIISIIFEFLYL